ncbi:sensor histidine kinase [Syntrophotalea acetylenica]|uniref:sensor histidine kinase n=1 Tax=Syntrophotalea acetylenica TaxID=29542 RepID=UPI002A366BE0|nr:sensor histidine kinase [Syntrophotalea acetylenica]MDY0263496.1 sensor histidine kinase [Syntrophotalea acetylenica]
MSSSGTYKIRPAGRHILTIGRDLIQDCYAAVVELVKNAYDADSRDVNIEFRAKPDRSGYAIVITDHGHGMSRDTVIHKWMVPSTRDKLDRRQSPAGRIMQGRKGVGRYAASILGTDLLLETVTPQGEKTTLLVEWNTFEAATYLDDVEILIETAEVSEPSGTRLTMTGDGELLGEWNQKQFDKLRFELKKLISPVSAAISDEVNDDEFRISLEIDGFPDVQDVTETIEPYPIFDLFDYRITGRIGADGKGALTYSLQKARNTTEDKIRFDAGGPTGCGELVFDIRVYDREREAIDSLLERGLNKYVGKLQARQLLNEYNGIGVYRNGFRIRPLGDAAFDWVELNKRRVQNPSKFIGSDQAIGYVLVQSDEESGLIEKSARDGLKENSAYSSLKKITTLIISKLEERRFSYRLQAGLGRSSRNIDRKIEKLFSTDELKKTVRSSLLKYGVGKDVVTDVIEIISRDAEDKNKVADDIRQTVAIYQGQATLGKIINVILHEGRRPLNYFRNQIPNLRYWYDSFLKTGDAGKLETFMPIAEGVGQNAEVFVKLFSRLDPLAAGKRTARKPLDLKKTIRNSLSVFDEEMKTYHVVAKVEGPDDFRFSSWQQDIYAIFTNLVDNSIYWMNEKNVPKREITIEVVTDGDSLLHVDYRDTGPGIEPDLIASEVIFEPQFSTKPSGTGLGLAIAGEAATRNGLELKSFESEQGAWFRLQPKTENE